MKTGIIVLCRYNSSRLPGKILKPLNGKPVLSYILERLSASNYASNVIIATSDQTSDDSIADYCEQTGVSLFRGSLDNVSQRFLDCAIQFELDYAVRVNGDNLFTDVDLIDQAVTLAIQGNYDFVTNVEGRTFPTGMSIEVVKVSFYCKSITKFDQPNYLEHVTYYFYQHPDSGNFNYLMNETLDAAHGLKLAVDCQEDFNFVSLLLNKMNKPHTSYGWMDIVKLATDER